MEDIQKKIDEEKKAFKEEGKGNKFWDIYFNYLEKESRDITKLKRAFNESTKNESQKNATEEHIKELHEIFEKFIISAPNHIHTLEELQRQYYHTKQERNNANKILCHKSNRTNLEKQIENIKK
jgi:hypothetical protein